MEPWIPCETHVKKNSHVLCCRYQMMITDGVCIVISRQCFTKRSTLFLSVAQLRVDT